MRLSNGALYVKLPNTRAGIVLDIGWLYLYVEYTAEVPLVDGLKVQTSGGMIELALADVGTHPLRIRKGATTYGIELVETNDPNASPIRIKLASGIKALRKYT